MTNQDKIRFVANHKEAVDAAMINLTNEEKEGLLRLFFANESMKKEAEINKNHNDVRSYNASRFAMQLEDRLRKKVYTSNKVSNVLNMDSIASVVQIESVIESDPNDELLVAAKANTKKSKA